MQKIKLYNEKFAIVDDEDFFNLAQYSWYVGKNGYVMRGIRKEEKNKEFSMHRYILKAKKGQEIDHINRNKLDNRKCNLRFCTRSENIINAGMLKNNISGVKGVHWSKWHERWMSYIEKDKKRLYLGFFKKKMDAIDARKKAEIFYYVTL